MAKDRVTNCYTWGPQAPGDAEDWGNQTEREADALAGVPRDQAGTEPAGSAAAFGGKSMPATRHHNAKEGSLGADVGHAGEHAELNRDPWNEPKGRTRGDDQD